MAGGASFSLLTQRRFAPFFVTQFLGAFNDNLFKNAVVILVAFQASSLGEGGNGAILVQLCAALFILPFFLFSGTAGQLADRTEKTRIIRAVKVLEIVIMTIGAFGLVMRNLPLLLAALFLMGLHSTIFGPVKYAILPQHLNRDELLGANGLVEMGTFVAILLGTLAGGLLIGLSDGGELLVGGSAIAVAAAGYVSSRFIPVAPAASPELVLEMNPLAETKRTISLTKRDPLVFTVLLAVSWFWFMGALYLGQFPALTTDVLHGNEHVVTLLLAVFSVGIGAGSVGCEKLAKGGDGAWLVLAGAVGMSLFGFDLCAGARSSVETLGAVAFLADPGNIRFLLDLLMVGVCGGLFIVPLYTLMQTASDESVRSRIIAGNNIWNAIFMVASAGVAAGFAASGLDPLRILVIGGVLNLAACAWFYPKLRREMRVRASASASVLSVGEESVSAVVESDPA
jgi:MFS family permease